MMDFQFTEEEEAFRKEVQDFLQESLPPDWLGIEAGMDERSEELYQFSIEMRRKLAAKGWLGLSWPRQYGGQEASAMKQIILDNELHYRSVPGYAIPTFSVNGPLILQFGTEEQKRRFIPPITRGEVLWAIGMSEPNVGSDFGALQLRAEEKEDCFVLNGQKIWLSGGHLADWCLVYARTDPNASLKGRGMSAFLVDLKSSGVTKRRIAKLSAYFAEILFDNVMVPKENLIGGKNQGWAVAIGSFAVDRTSTSVYILYAKRDFELLVQYCQETYVNGQPLTKNPIIRNKLAGMAIEIEIGYAFSSRLSWMASKEMSVTSESSQMKVLDGRIAQRFAKLAMQILGLYGQLDGKSKWSKLRGKILEDYLYAVGTTIAAGTSEISKNAIARIGMGLPEAY